MPDCRVPAQPAIADESPAGRPSRSSCSVLFGGGWAGREPSTSSARSTSPTRAWARLLATGNRRRHRLSAAIGGAITDRWGAGRSLTRALVVWGRVSHFGGRRTPPRAVRPPHWFLAMGRRRTRRRGHEHRRGRRALARTPGRLVRFHGLWNAGFASRARRFNRVWRCASARRVRVRVGRGSQSSAWEPAIVTRRTRLPETRNASIIRPMWRAARGPTPRGDSSCSALVFGAVGDGRGWHRHLGHPVSPQPSRDWGVLAGVEWRTSWAEKPRHVRPARRRPDDRPPRHPARRWCWGASLSAAGDRNRSAVRDGGQSRPRGLAAAAGRPSRSCGRSCSADVNNEGAASRARDRRDHRVRLTSGWSPGRRSSGPSRASSV